MNDINDIKWKIDYFPDYFYLLIVCFLFAILFYLLLNYFFKVKSNNKKNDIVKISFYDLVKIFNKFEKSYKDMDDTEFFSSLKNIFDTYVLIKYWKDTSWLSYTEFKEIIKDQKLISKLEYIYFPMYKKEKLNISREEYILDFKKFFGINN